MAVVLQVVGLIVVCAGVYVCFGLGPALVGAGLAVLALGVSAELGRS